MAGKDYYEILGAKRDASEDELKKLYRKLSMALHPDRQAGKSEAEKKEAEEKFKEVNEAYSVLSDPDKRRNYDQFGSAEGPGQMGGGGGFGGFDPMSFFRKMHAGFGFGRDEDDGFDGFDGFGFGNGGRSGGMAPDIDSPEDGSDVQTRITVSFKESVTGCTKEFDFGLDRECPECHGTGAEKGAKPEKCRTCGGRGRVVHVSRMGPMVTQQVTECPDCHGTGYSVKPCPHCHGAKRVDERRHVKVKVPAGFQDGKQLRLKGLGRCGIKGGTSGDLYVVVRVEESDIFLREGNDILLKAFVSPAAATFGGKIEVPTPYGYKHVKIAAGTESGTRLKVAGAGIRPAVGQTGDMYIDISVEPYSDLSQEQKELLEKLQKTERQTNFKKASELRKKAEEFYS